LYFDKSDILNFWQHENAYLSKDKLDEFLGSIEVCELINITKSAVLKGFCVNQRIYSSVFVIEQKRVHSMECRIWASKSHGFVLRNANSWEFTTSYNRKARLFDEWQALYGELSTRHILSFFSNPNVDEIVQYQLEDVLNELSRNKKVENILAGLKESDCHKKIELDERLQGAIELNLMDEAIRAEKLFKSLNETFREEIEQKNRAEKSPYMNFGSKSGSRSQQLGGSDVCNSCGMRIGLFNEHSC
jgi:hypothetical protein